MQVFWKEPFKKGKKPKFFAQKIPQIHSLIVGGKKNKGNSELNQKMTEKANEVFVGTFIQDINKALDKAEKLGKGLKLP